MTRAILRGAGSLRLLFLSSPERDAILLSRTIRKGCGMETVKSRAEQRVLLRNISWETYERLLDERGDSRVPRLAYDRGDLEIMSPSSEHESVAYFVALLVAVLAEEMRVNAYGVGSTTYRRGDIGRGFEPDGSFYIRNEERIRGKPRIDLSVDPPPDLVLEGSDYAKTAESIVLPPVTSKVLTDFVEKIKSVERKAWLKEVREWSRENTGTSSRTRPYLSCGQRSEGSCSPRLTL